MASEEKCALLKSVLVNADSSEQELTQAYLQLAFQYTSNKSSKNDERSHAARLRDITSLFLKRVPAEKYKGQSDDEILLHVFKDAVSFTFKDNSQSRVLDSSSSQSHESTPNLNGCPTPQQVQDSEPTSQATPNIFSLIQGSPSKVTNKQECIQDQVVGQTKSQVKTESVFNSEEAQHSVSGYTTNQDQVKVDSTRSSSSPVKGIGQASQNTVSHTHRDTINETACEQQKAKDIDQAKVGGERKGNHEQYHRQECGGSQVESTIQLSESIFNHNSSAINMSQWSESQKGAWPNGPVTSSGWTPMDPSHGQSAISQDNGKGNSQSGSGVMSSIWGSSSSSGSTPTSSGWGGIPSSTSSSSPFHPGLFQNSTSNGHSGGSSVWGTPTTPQPGGKGSLPFGGTNPISAPSTTSASNPSTSQSSGWDTSANQNGMEPQPASTPTSAESNPPVPTSQSSGSAPSNGNGNSGNANEGGSASNGQEPQQQIPTSSTVTSNAQGSSWGSSNPPGPSTLTGTSAWGAPQAQSSGGWGADPSGQSGGQENKQWGSGNSMPPTSTRGWGGSNPMQNPNEVSGAGGWGKPPPSEATSGWGGRPSTTPTSGPPPGPPSGWNKEGNKEQPAAPGWNNPPGWGNQPNQPPGPGGMKKDQPDGGQPGWGKPSGNGSWAQTASKGAPDHRGMNPGETTPVDQASIAALVKTPWGKRPINQEMKWDSKAPQQPSINQSGTSGWGSQPASDRQWEKAEQPKQSAWGKPNPPQTPTESSWGNQPPTSAPPTSSQTSGWGPPKERNDNQDPGWGQPPTTSASSGMPGGPGPLGPPGSQAIGPPGSQAMGPPGQPGSHGPPSTPGFSTDRSSPPQKDAMETGSNASSNTPQPPAEDPSQIPGPPPKKIVATGWGDVTMVTRQGIQTVDNGTSHWGDPSDHNRRLTRRQAGGHMPQMGGNPQNSTMQGPPPSGPQGDTAMPPSSMMPNAPPSQFKADNQWDDKSKPGSWGDFPNQRSNNNNSSGSMWNQQGGSKWDQSSTSSWGPSSSTTGSTQSKDSMQQNWHDDNSTGSIGHWGDEEWENRSQSSESMSGWRGGPKKPRPPGQRESNHYISKLKRLMDYGYPKEVAEVALRKHNFHFETALTELRQISDMMDQNKMPSGDVDDPVRQMSRTMSNMGIGDNPLTSGSDLTNANMLLNNSLPGTLPLGGKPSNMMGTPGFMPTGSVGQRFSGQQQVMGQQPGSLNQPPRGPFNQQQQMMQQQQHQQLFQVLLQLAVQSGIVNQSLLQQQVTPTQIMSIVQRYPQLLAQAQAQQGNLAQVGGGNSVGKGMGSSAPNRSQQELMARFVQQQLLQGQRPPVSRQPFPQRPKMRSDSEMYSNTNTSSDLLGNISNMNPDIGMREPLQQSRLQHLFGKPGAKNFPRTNRSESVTGLPDNNRRGSNWSRSNSPTPSDSIPNSADSAFSDGWNFPQPENLSSITDDVPEFIPGVPWNPQPSLDVSNDPSATPGMYAPTKPSGRDKDDISGILTRPMKPQAPWSSNQPGGGRKTSWNYEGGSGQGFSGTGGNAGSRSNQLWNSAPGNQQRATRPPPGLGEHPHSNSWRGSWDAPSGKNPLMQGHAVTHRSSWSSGNGISGANSILISGVTSDMNVSALRNICGQQGQVDQFQENRAQGSVMVTYRFPDDATKALNTITTTFPNVIAELVSPSDAFSTPASSSSGWPQGGGSSGSKFGNGVLPSTSSASSAGKDDVSGSSKQSWSAGLPGMPGSQLWSPGPGGSMGWSPMDGDSSSAPNFSFLPGDLLGESTN